MGVAVSLQLEAHRHMPDVSHLLRDQTYFKLNLRDNNNEAVLAQWILVSLQVSLSSCKLLLSTSINFGPLLKTEKS